MSYVVNIVIYNNFMLNRLCRAEKKKISTYLVTNEQTRGHPFRWENRCTSFTQPASTRIELVIDRRINGRTNYECV